MRKINKIIISIIILLILILSLTACISNDRVGSVTQLAQATSEPTENAKLIEQDAEPTYTSTAQSTLEPTPESTLEPTPEPTPTPVSHFEGYTLIQVDGGDLSGYRQPNVVVDIGFGDREYYAFTNEHGQLVKVTASRIVLQDENKEPVTSEGRYYHDEAKVPGTESNSLDEGHVIADSLGGVANAYNITPQNSILNRYGDQAYMEKVIRDAGGCTDFVAEIIYPNTSTQIPSHYKFSYILKGNLIIDEFDNINPDEVNATPTPTVEETQAPAVEVAYVGSAKSDKYHYLSCGSAKNILPENLVEFTSKEDAENHGYVPCGRCKP